MSTERHLPAPIETGRNLPQLLALTAAQHPDDVALVINDARISYGELWSRVGAIASHLATIGIGKGDRVALMLPNTPAYVMASYAAHLRGAVLVNVSPGSQGMELGHILADSGASLLVALDVFLPALYRVLGQTAVKHLWVSSVQGLEKKIPTPPGLPVPQIFEERCRPTAPAAPPTTVVADDLAVLQYTSGATGTPKAVRLTHRNLLATVDQVRDWMRADEVQNAGVVCVIPFFHVFGMTIGMHVSVAKGHKMILVPRFDALDLMPLVRLIETHRPLSFPAVPTLWATLLSMPGVTAQTLASVQVATSGGAPLPAWVQDKFGSLTGKRIYEAFGLSEAAGATHCAPFPAGAPAGSVGQPLSRVKARVVDLESGTRDVAVGEVGELVVQGEPIMNGYWNNEALTQRALRDGWLHTGDLARIDAEGNFYIVDRKDDLILSSGHNVYPSEVEVVLATHPAVRDAVVFGQADKLRGAVVMAHVVLKEGATATRDELVQHCRANLPDYKVPRSVVLTDTVPRNPVGKTLRRELQQKPARPGDG